jgi:RsiW-degrading membrane proteinase PrsW (M82 family)
VTLLLLLYKIPPLSWIEPWTSSPEFAVRWLGYFLAVGIPEELCKALALLVIWKKAEPYAPQTMLFYGLMAGLGFGVYEGVDYQLGRNVRFSDTIGEYYLLNVLRLTSLPFLHAIWSGIAGYFLGFALLHTKRRRGLFIVAIGLPALLHGTYDAANSAIIQLGIALFSVIALNLYLAKSVELERAVAEQQAAAEQQASAVENPPPT